MRRRRKSALRENVSQDRKYCCRNTLVVDCKPFANPHRQDRGIRFSSTMLQVAVDVICGCERKSWRTALKMAFPSPKILVLATCLVLLTLVSPCMPCTCQQGKDDNHHHERLTATPDGGVDHAHTRCSVCNAGANLRQPQRTRVTDRLCRHLVATTWNNVVLNDETVVFRTVFCSDALPSLDIQELQVRLE